MRGAPWPRLGSTEHEKKEVGTIEPEKIAKQRRIVKRNYVDSLSLHVGFAGLEYLLVLNYPIVTKKLTDFRSRRLAG
jgi:hypothetical protein